MSYQNEQILEPSLDSFEWCMANGGKDESPNYNAPKVCALQNKIYNQNCVSNEKYSVIAGPNILVKYKSSDKQIISCDYSVGSGDFQIVGDAEYILALENNFLIIDSGTGPDPRSLIIYDLNTRKKIYNDSYSKPVDIKNNTVNYWTGTATPVTDQNCPESKQWKAEGLGAAIDSYVSLNLPTLIKTALGEYRCSPRQ